MVSHTLASIEHQGKKSQLNMQYWPCAAFESSWPCVLEKEETKYSVIHEYQHRKGPHTSASKPFRLSTIVMVTVFLFPFISEFYLYIETIFRVDLSSHCFACLSHRC